MNVGYDAVWLPVGHEVAGQDPTALAVQDVEQRCMRAGVRGTLVTFRRGDAATPSLERFAREQSHVTSRTRSGAVAGKGLVLVDMPDAGLLAYAHRLARGWSLCAVESGGFRLGGWASATGAVDLVAGKSAPPPSAVAFELLDALVFVGNNGWADRPGKRDALRLLGELAGADPSLDSDFVAGYVIGKGASGEGARRLAAMAAKAGV